MYKPRHIQLTVPDPCGQDWEKMKKDAGGKFCDQCSKKVIDFTTWTDAELHNFFSKRNEHVCGRFLDTQLDRTIRIPHQPHSQLYRIAVALGAVLLFTHTPDAKAYARPPMVWSASVINEVDTMAATDTTKSSLIGRVLDDRKEPVVNASITIKQGGVTKGITVSDFDGNYEIKALEPGTYDVTFSYVGFEAKTMTGMTISHNEQTMLNVTLNAAHRKMMGEGVVYYKKGLVLGGAMQQSILTTKEINPKPTAQTQDFVPVTANNARYKVAVDTVKGTLCGIVYDDQHKPAGNVSISIKQGGLTKAIAVSNGDGSYTSFKSLEPGVYDVVFSCAGYDTTTITGVFVSPNSQTPLNMAFRVPHGRKSKKLKPLTDDYGEKTIMTGDEIKRKPGP